MGRSGLRVQELKEQAPRSTSSYQCRRHPAWGAGIPIYRGTTMSRSPPLLFRLLPFFVCSSSGLGLLFNKQGRMLLTKAKGAAPRQKLGVRRWFTTGITSPNMGFHGFHSYHLPPIRLVYRHESPGLTHEILKGS